MPTSRGREVIVVGSQGQIGAAILRRLAEQDARPIRFGAVDATTDDDELRRLLAASAETDVVVAAGLTDPSLGEQCLRLANVELVRRIARALPAGARLLTLGTVHETISALIVRNPYVASKRELATWMAEERARTRRADRLHLRLHTVYGGTPRPHMFLGQMAVALRERRTFKMSAGRQTREYLHVDEVAESIARVLEREWEPLPVTVELSTGAATSLAELAHAVFAAFAATPLLQVGALAAQPGDDSEHRFERSPEWLLPTTRDPVQGVIDWMAAWLPTATAENGPR